MNGFKDLIDITIGSIEREIDERILELSFRLKNNLDLLPFPGQKKRKKAETHPSHVPLETHEQFPILSVLLRKSSSRCGAEPSWNWQTQKSRLALR
jgi:hypothetical protein